jgi:beta-glucan synthesis-associated protein KRE6
MAAQYILANLGMSPQFGRIDFQRLQFPVTMRVDYIRVYQQKDQINIGCDPEAYPTMSYINQSVALFFSLDTLV